MHECIGGRLANYVFDSDSCYYDYKAVSFDALLIKYDGAEKVLLHTDYTDCILSFNSVVAAVLSIEKMFSWFL